MKRENDIQILQDSIKWLIRRLSHIWTWMFQQRNEAEDTANEAKQ